MVRDTSETNGLDVKLVRLHADDGQFLDALRYDAADRSCTTAVIHLHGKGSSFLGGPGRFMPPLWPEVTHLALNMRCRDLAWTNAELPSPDFTEGDVPVAGGMWESIADGHRDVAAAVEHLFALGHTHVFLAGHSSGGFYTADYCARDPRIAGRIFISPLTGNGTAIKVWFPEADSRAAAVVRAEQMVAEGRGHHLLVLPSWFYAMSARSFLERAAEPDGVWLEAVNRSTAPALMVWGSAESRHDLWHDLTQRFTAPIAREAVIEGAEHHFVGDEQELTDIARRFVDEVLAAEL
jgi:pimeloyl-ACP methyl ester carboxylesterase